MPLLSASKIIMRHAASCPQPSRSSAVPELLLDAFPHVRHAPISTEEDASSEGFPAIPIHQGASFDTQAVAPTSSRVEFLDILASLDIGVLILGKYLTAENRAALACTCTPTSLFASYYFILPFLSLSCLPSLAPLMHISISHPPRLPLQGWVTVAT
ncbi:hypothetical protein CYMTET_20601 [Cymbomonas tetramitiformis]|uniref:Uncharacterized protein n=1 Tax=Cymbomonas tetramitiformis TaxID=36881 RepID=A0AAE0G3U3_9CHLO|nr:hypothetical protein CYMTET_20601 [Cymbomonas tetramitiformis]